jgi:hypothetical protein
METYVVKLVQFHVDWNSKAKNIGTVLSDQQVGDLDVREFWF